MGGGVGTRGDQKAIVYWEGKQCQVVIDMQEHLSKEMHSKQENQLKPTAEKKRRELGRNFPFCNPVLSFRNPRSLLKNCRAEQPHYIVYNIL